MIFWVLFFMLILFAICWRLMVWGLKLAFSLCIILLILAILCIPVEAYEYSPEDIVAIGKLVEHEAPHESELGQRLVVDTVLNRVESAEFPNTVSDVLNQPGQYCKPKKFPPEHIYKLIAEEIYNRTNNQVLWFRTKRYHSYGKPICVEGSHYFSGR